MKAPPIGFSPGANFARMTARVFATLLLAVLCTTAYAQTTQPQALADRMLERLGGRTLWAELRNTINGSVQNRVEEPVAVYSVITMDFQKPRFRIETTAQDLHLIRVIDGENSWRLRRAGNIEDVPEDAYCRGHEVVCRASLPHDSSGRRARCLPDVWNRRWWAP